MKIKNFEIVNEKNSVLITYSLEDGKALEGLNNVSIVFKQNNSNNFNMFVVGKDIEIAEFENIDFKIINDLNDKRILIAGLDVDTDEIKEVALVSGMSVELSKKLKIRN